MDPLQNSGRSLYTNSVDLAYQLMTQQTHLIGTLHSARKLNPKSVTTTKLSWGEMIMRQSNTNVIVAKAFIDTSHQKASYTNASPVRRSMKWYRKTGMELLGNTAIVNALIVYEMVMQEKMKITNFREKIAVATFNTYIDLCNATNVEFKAAPEHK
ncbi:Transposase IS4 [Popillia japonica]|uniref:Transposase IS4 n=1 Tax=Popillia japonica TaxID=7064 RepID=A0AAW1N4A0_POPJA